MTARFQILEVDGAEHQRSSLEAAEPDKGSAASLFVRSSFCPLVASPELSHPTDTQHGSTIARTTARSATAAPHSSSTQHYPAPGETHRLSHVTRR
jgi:hypothetical protein